MFMKQLMKMNDPSDFMNSKDIQSSFPLCIIILHREVNNLLNGSMKVHINNKCFILVSITCESSKR
jgi:hypothetical protein